MTTKFMSNMSRTFSNSGFSRTYSSAPKPFHFTKLHQANMSPLPPPATQPKAKKSRSSCMAICCCCFTGCVSMLITAAIGLGLAALIIWLVLRPIRTPTFEMNSITISRLVYTPTPNRTLDAAASYTVLTYNGNGKIGIKYESIGVDSSYQGQVFHHQDIPGFYHGKRQNATIAGNFSVTGYTLDPVRGAALQAEVAAQDVTLLIRVNVKAKLKIGAIYTPSFNVHVNCDVGIRPPSPTAAAIVLRKSCKRV